MTALEAEVRVETVTKGGRRSTAALRKKGADAARNRQESKEANKLGSLYRLRKRRTCEASPIVRVKEPVQVA